jgi:hypothetical protein
MAIVRALLSYIRFFALAPSCPQYFGVGPPSRPFVAGDVVTLSRLLYVFAAAHIEVRTADESSPVLSGSTLTCARLQVVFSHLYTVSTLTRHSCASNASHHRKS